MKGCICSRSRRDWQSDGVCATCGQRVLEDQLTPVLLQILCGGTGLVLWRNNAGLNTHWPTGEKRKAAIRYGVGDGGADYIGLYVDGRFVGVEFKTADGVQQENQRSFESIVRRHNGVYAIVRNENDARDLLERLRSKHE